MATILLVEDDSEVMDAVADLLESHNHKILKAINGAQAIEHFSWHTNIIDLVVSDYDMQPCNGLNVLREVRKYKTKTELPFILHTGSIDPKIEKRCLELEGIFCSKSSGQLISMVEELLKK